MQIRFVCEDFEAKALFARQRIEVVNDFEPVLRSIRIGPAKIAEVIECAVGIVPKKPAYRNDIFILNMKSCLGTKFCCLEKARRELGF